MTGKEAVRSNARRTNWKYFSALGTVAAAVSLCVAARFVWGPATAGAQTAKSRVQQASATTAPVTTVPKPVAASGGAPTTAAAPASQAPGVVANVNGQQITRDDLARECLARYGKDMLESMVNKHLIWQACQKRNITITQQDVENEINGMAQKFGLSTDRWLAMLEQERDISPDQYRREIIWPTLALRRLATDQIRVGEDELKVAFESEYGPKVKVRMIAVSSRQKADEIYQKATANPDSFGDLAKQYSEDANSASARGLVPPISRHFGPKEVENAAFALKEGQISPVVAVANQYLIFRCEKHLPESYISSQQLPQIRAQLEDRIRDQKLRAAAADLFQKLQQEAQVVNVMNNPQLQAKSPGVAATINGQAITLKQVADECVLRHGKEIVDGEINRLVLQQELTKRGKTVAQPDIDAEIVRAADAYGYIKPDGTPDVAEWLKAVTQTDNVTVELYVRDAVWPSVALKQLVGDTIQVTKEDLEKGFAANYGERVEILAIVVGNQRQANTVWEMARNNPTDQFFGELASQYSVEPVSRGNFGKVPPIRRYGGQPLIEEEAFRLKAGELSGIISVGDKYIIVKCLGRTEPVVQDMAAVEPELRKDLHEKKLRVAMAQEFDRLKESARIDNFLSGSSTTGSRAASVPTSAAGAATVPSPLAPTRR
jgi:parvulin-like peptidyl-prolyl isomerase